MAAESLASASLPKMGAPSLFHQLQRRHQQQHHPASPRPPSSPRSTGRGRSRSPIELGADQQQPLAASLGSSSASSLSGGGSGSLPAAAPENFALGLQAYRAARAAGGRSDREALAQFGTALELFQTAAVAVSGGTPPGRTANAVLHQALCLEAMARVLARGRAAAAAAALPLWDQALESLERVLADCHRRSERLPDGAARGEVCCLDGCMVDILRHKAATLMALAASMARTPPRRSEQQPDDDDDDPTESELRNLRAEAMDCMIQALRFLLDVRYFEQTRQAPHAHAASSSTTSSSSLAMATVVYSCLSIAQHSELLLETVQQTLRQYRAQDDPAKARGRDGGEADADKPLDEPVWLQRVEQALHVLQTRQYELTKTQRLAMASIQEHLSQIYLELADLEQASQALTDACDWMLSEQETPPPQWLDRMELIGSLLEQEAVASGYANIDDDQFSQDETAAEAAATLDLAMSCYEKALLIRNQCSSLNAKASDQNPLHQVAIANALLHVSRVMRLQGNDEGSMDLFRAAQDIYSRQTDYQVLAPIAAAAVKYERWDQAVAVLSQCLELAESASKDDNEDNDLKAKASEDDKMDKTYIYYSLAQAYIGRAEYVPATMCLMEAIKYEGQVSEQKIYSLLQQVEFLRREEHRMDFDDIIIDAQFTGDTSGDDRLRAGDSSVMESDADDEGTAFYDSESVSAFNPLVGEGTVQNRPLNQHAAEGRVVVDFDFLSQKDGVLDEEIQRALEISLTGSEAAEQKVPSEDKVGEDTDADEEPPPPVVSPDPSLADGHQRPPASPSRASSQRLSKQASMDKGSVHSAPSIPSLMKRLGSPLRGRKDPGSDGGESSQRPGLAKAIANTFRLSGSHRSEDKVVTDHDNAKDNGDANLPSEQEFHSAVDGPLEFIHVKRVNSWESDISSITVRMEDPNSSGSPGGEPWWGVSAEGLGRWLPTVVNTAVEAAEGFLSARSIHSQKKHSSLFDYATSDDSDDESEPVDVADRPEDHGVADSRTQRAVRDSRGSFSRARQAAFSGAPYDSSALSIYSGHRRKAEELDAEIDRCTKLAADKEKTYGRNHLFFANSLFTLAVLYSQQGASGAELAIEHAVEALRIQKECDTTDEASRSLHFLADIYFHQKQYSTSLTCFAEALRLERFHFGDYSDEAAKTLNCIGKVHLVQKNFQRAMECHREALHILQQCHGEDAKNPLVSETLCQIGAVYYRERNSFSRSKPSGSDKYSTFIEAGMLEMIGRAHEDRGSYKMAIAFFEERLAFLENRQSSHEAADLEEVAETINSLGMLSFRAGRFAESLDYYGKAIRIQLKLGHDRVQLATIRVLMGGVHFQHGNWKGALELLLEALAVLVEELGRVHETVAATLYQIGVVRAGLYQLDEAMQVLTEAVDIQDRLLGHDHPATLRTRREIGNIYALNTLECDTALEQFDEILTAQRAIHGDRHPNIAETLFSIGQAYARRGDFASALQILEETYYMRTETLGHDVPSQAATLHAISRIHLQRRHIKRALQICDVVLTIREESLLDTHVDVALTRAVKGRCFVAQNRLEDADALLGGALSKAVEAVGEWHPSVAEIHVALSSLHLKRCHFDRAQSCVETALAIYVGAGLNEDFPPCLEAKQQLERIQHDEALFV